MLLKEREKHVFFGIIAKKRIEIKILKTKDCDSHGWSITDTSSNEEGEERKTIFNIFNIRLLKVVNFRLKIHFENISFTSKP